MSGHGDLLYKFLDHYQDSSMDGDLVVLFLAYSFSVVALLVSIYAIWTLKEVEDQYKNKVDALKSREKIINKPAIKVPRKKGNWD